MKKPRLTWRRGSDERKRGCDLRHKNERLGGAYPIATGYYCWGRWDMMGVPLINTANQPVATIDEAKSQLKAHFDQYLAAYLESHKDD